MISQVRKVTFMKAQFEVGKSKLFIDRINLYLLNSVYPLVANDRRY